MRPIVSLLFFFCYFSFSALGLAQDLNDIQNVEIDDLTDKQIESVITRAQESGLTQQQLESLARQRGMSSVQIDKLRTRILEVQSGQRTPNTLKESDSRLREESIQMPSDTTIFDIFFFEKEEEGLQIFGSQIFESEMQFETSNNVATPANYIVGAGDELIIDVYGASETTYRKQVSPDGKILISGVGPISVGGLELRNVRSTLFDRLSAIYAGLKGNSPNTFLQVTIGNIKTIKVNVVGNAKRPGTYAMSSFSTAFNAIYAAGGPNEFGSMRSIDIMRAGEKIASLDIYRFFYWGDISQNPTLQDEDVVVIRPFENRVVFAGEVKQPAIYEFKEDETLEDLMLVSGGLLPTGFGEKITLFRSYTGRRSVATVSKTYRSKEKLYAGDSIFINPINEVYTNRVLVEGAVLNPGYYELTEELTLKSLLAISQLAREAFKSRGNIIRLNDDLTLSNLTFDVNEVINGSLDISLQAEDIVRLASLLDVRERETVTLRGEVLKEGEYPFARGMTVEDLITLSGGLKNSANTKNVEVARRVSKNEKDFKTAVLYEFVIDENLDVSDSASRFLLQPFDLVTIKASALFRTQRTIKIEGEVMRPGIYALESEEDRISDIVERAGGLTTFAYPKGASLIRDMTAKVQSTTSVVEAINYRSSQLETLVDRDSIADDLDPFKGREGVGIQLDRALKDRLSKFNFVLEDGDVVSIPKQQQTVKIRGEVLFPTRVKFDPQNSLANYVWLSGGFSDRALRRKAYVVYPNGRAKRTTNFLFFKFYPKVEPGSDIFIPKKPDRRKLTPGEVVGISSGLATLGFIIIQIVNATN